MKKLLVAMAIAIPVAIPAHAQSFNCNHAKTPDEVLICQSPKLTQMDEKLADVYFALRNALYTPFRRRLEAEQSAWLRHRIQCGRDELCVEHEYRMRTAELQSLYDAVINTPGE
jgi:uncharacterized protein